MKPLKTHMIVKNIMGTFCSTNWVDDGRNRVTKLSYRWKTVTCKKCLKMKQK